MFVSVPSRAKPGLPWATPLLLAALWMAYLWVSMRRPEVRTALVTQWGVLTGGLDSWPAVVASLRDGRWMRLLSALFLHANWIHLIGNMVFLLIFGLPAERSMGPWRFLLLFLLGGAIANLAAVLVIGSERLVIGASGAVSAVLGAYMTLFPGARLGLVVPLGLFLEFVRAPASLLIGVWAVLQVIFAYIGPAFGTVAWIAHAAGFVFGICFAVAIRGAIMRRMRHRRGY